MSQHLGNPLLSLSFLLLGNCLVVYGVIVQDHEQIHGENSLLENLQVLLLATGAFLYLWLSGKALTSARFLYLALALLSFSFILRELDLEQLPVPGFIQLLGSGMVRNILLAVTAVPLSFLITPTSSAESILVCRAVA